jgi:hypothetical protein
MTTRNASGECGSDAMNAVTDEFGIDSQFPWLVGVDERVVGK